MFAFLVLNQMFSSRALVRTLGALVRLFASVAANVSGEVTFLDTLIIAVWTFKWFVSRVGP